MLPPVTAFEVMESAAVVVAGGVTYSDCGVIYSPPGPGPSDLAADASAGRITASSPRIDVRKDQVPALPVGSRITGAMDGAPTRTYRVNHVDGSDPQYHLAWVS